MQWTEIPREDLTLPGEMKHRTVTPFFRYESVFNEPQSKLQGKAVHDLKEIVEIRFATNSQYKPVFGVDEMCEMDEATGRIITWAERYKPQYQAFLAGSEQEAEGTPLEELLPFGISQAQLSLCRALNIYSIEALAHLPAGGAKKLGMNGNTIIPMAERFIAARAGGAAVQNEVNELKRQLAELQAANGGGAVINPFSTVIPQEPPVLPEGYEGMTDAELKDGIERMTGARPRGNPSRATLENMMDQVKAA